jgi:hypothetical protein
MAKLAIETKKKGAQSTPVPAKEKGGPPRKVITFRFLFFFNYHPIN